MTRGRLLAEILLARVGHGNALAIAALVATSIGLALHSIYLEQAEDRLTAEIESVQQRQSLRVAARQPNTDAGRLAAFHATLGAREHLDEHMRRIFAAASRNTVALHAGEYRLVEDPAGGPDRYEIAFPVTASFRSLQAFVGDALLQLPFAALEKLTFRRETVDAAEVTAEIRMVLFLSNEVTAGKPASTHRTQGRR